MHAIHNPNKFLRETTQLWSAIITHQFIVQTNIGIVDECGLVSAIQRYVFLISLVSHYVIINLYWYGKKKCNDNWYYTRPVPMNLLLVDSSKKVKDSCSILGSCQL